MLNGQFLKLNTVADPSLREDLLGEAIARSRRVPCPAGSLLLWDSRLVHQGWAGGPRLAQPVSWEPKERRDEAALRRKLWMCAVGVPSSHSASEAQIHPMAPCQRPVPFRAYGPAMAASIVPFGVASEKESEWEAMQDLLWGRHGPDRTDEAKLRAILRDEVVAVL